MPTITAYVGTEGPTGVVIPRRRATLYFNRLVPTVEAFEGHDWVIDTDFVKITLSDEINTVTLPVGIWQVTEAWQTGGKFLISLVADIDYSDLVPLDPEVLEPYDPATSTIIDELMTRPTLAQISEEYVHFDGTDFIQHGEVIPPAFVIITQAAYNALTPPDPTTIYLITQE